ncbi:MAG: hypothetical protein M0R66_03025 [Candidatus Omnitrophica bacterium]|nr:hypothetical protein [Candidatus Omnitrophota bacterium]
MTTRKKPGRPRKKIDARPIGQYGIASDPLFADDCVELIYSQPQLFKCIVSIFKEYDSDEVIMEFYPDRVIMTGKDHSLRVVIRIAINAADMNLYYFGAGAACDPAPAMIDDDANAATPYCSPAHYRIVIKRDNLEIVTAIIEKSHYKMMIALHRDDPSSLFVILSSYDYDSDDCFEISIVPRAATSADAFDAPDLAQYPLEFTLDSHHLRRKIGELKKVSPDMIIKKVGSRGDAAAQLDARGSDGGDVSRISERDPGAIDESDSAGAQTGGAAAAAATIEDRTALARVRHADLEISFGAVARVVYTGTYRAAAKIKLRSAIPDGATFIATTSISRIRPLMSVNMPGGITFFANYVDPLVIQVGLDARAAVVGNRAIAGDRATADATDSGGHFAIVAQLFINTAH